MKRKLWIPALAWSLWSFGGTAMSQTSDIFRDADLGLGAKLIVEHKCDACHARRVGGDGSAIYRPQGRIHNAGLLRGMVEYCNTELNLQLFPEDVNAIAAVLQRDHYRFGLSPAAPARPASTR